MAKTPESVKLRSHLRRSAGVSILLIVAASCALSLFVASRAFRNEAKAHEQALVDLLAQLVAPSLSVSDSGETQRLINLLASENKSLPLVITAAGDVLMGDYSSFPLAAQLKLGSGRWPQACGNLPPELTGHDAYFIQCASILGSSAGSADKSELGIAVLLVPRLSLKVPGTLALELVAVFLTLGILPWFLFNRSIRTRILSPLEALSDSVRALSKSKINSADLRIQGDPKEWPEELKLLANEFSQLLRGMQTQHSELQAIQKRESQFYLAKQIAHDIRSPLSALKVVAQMLNDKDLESHRLLMVACNRIQSMADDLLNRSREDLRVDDPADVDAGNLVSELLEEKRLEYQGQATRFDLNFLTDRTLPFAANRSGMSNLKRALSNLLNNAVEASALRGQEQVSVDLLTDNEHLMIRVNDHGPGFPDSVLGNLGKVGVTFGKSEGNGLGLAGAIAAVKALGGDLGVKSSNTGSSVTIRLPIKPRHQNKSQSEPRQLAQATL